MSTIKKRTIVEHLQVSRLVRVTGVAVVASALVLSAPTMATATTAPEVVDILSAIENSAPEVLEGVAAAQTSTEGSVAIQSRTVHSTISVPSDAESGITIGGGNSSSSVQRKNETITVGLPFAEAAGHAETVSAGIVSYDNGNGSKTIPVMKSDGSIQVTTLIESSAAPTSYSYPISLPVGGSMQVASNGGVVILNANHDVISYVAPAWAKDANGVSIPSSYTVEGATLIQTVDLSSAAVEYPVVADPQFAWYGGILPSIQLSKAETRTATTATGMATVCGFVTKYLGYPAGIACGVSAVQIMLKSIQNVANGKCSQLVPAPGFVLAYFYTGGYCR